MEELKKPNKTWIRPGRKGFDIDYVEIAKIYIEADESLDSLASRFGVSKWTLLARFKKLGVKKTIRRYQDDNIFSTYTPESCYWAGFIAADGNIGKYRLSLELSIIDRNHIEKFVNFIKGNTKITERKKIVFGKEKEFCSVYVNSKQMILDLGKNFNVIAAKSLVYKPPIQLPRNMISHFIRGYIDGDGCVGWHKEHEMPRVGSSSGSKELLQWVSDNIRLYNSEAGNPKVAKRKDSNLYTLEFNGNQSYEILDWLYKDATYYLKRKYNRYMEYTSQNVVS